MQFETKIHRVKSEKFYSIGPLALLAAWGEVLVAGGCYQSVSSQLSLSRLWLDDHTDCTIHIKYANSGLVPKIARTNRHKAKCFQIQEICPFESLGKPKKLKSCHFN